MTTFGLGSAISESIPEMQPTDTAVLSILLKCSEKTEAANRTFIEKMRKHIDVWGSMQGPMRTQTAKALLPILNSELVVDVNDAESLVTKISTATDGYRKYIEKQSNPNALLTKATAIDSAPVTANADKDFIPGLYSHLLTEEA